MGGIFRRMICSGLVIGGLANGQPRPQVDVNGPVIRQGEQFGVLYFSVRSNYIYPQTATVPEGWYRIVIDNPHRVTGNAVARVDDERGAPLREKPVQAPDFRTSFYQRLTPGRHTLRIGAKEEWAVTVTVTARRP